MKLLGALFLLCSNAFAGEMEDLISRMNTVCDGLNKKTTACADTRALPLPQASQKISTDGKRCSGSKNTDSKSASVDGEKGTSLTVSELTEKDLDELSKFLSGKARRYGLTDDPHVRQSVCAQRAQMVAYDFLNDCGVKSAKIFATGSIGKITEKLGTTYDWDSFHVANVVYVRKNGKLEPFVIDKLLSDQPLTLDAWKAKINSSGKVSFRMTDPSVRGPNDSPNPSFGGRADESWGLQGIEKKINEGVQMRR